MLFADYLCITGRFFFDDTQYSGLFSLAKDGRSEYDGCARYLAHAHHLMKENGSEDHGKDSLGAHYERGRRGVCIFLTDYLQSVAAGSRDKCLV